MAAPIGAAKCLQVKAPGIRAVPTGRLGQTGMAQTAVLRPRYGIGDIEDKSLDQVGSGLKMMR
jgi:hypothetical protein